MKRLRMIMAAAFLVALAWPASMAAAVSLPSWDLTGTYTVVYTCTSGCTSTYVNSMTITSSSHSTGAVAGTGFVEGYAGYDYSVTGTVGGSNVTLNIEWAESSGLQASNPLVATGTIDQSGEMSGTASDAWGRTFNWATTAGAATPIDRDPPTATLTAPASPTSAATLSYSLGFNESVSGLAAADFTRTGTATGCSVGAPSGSGASYTVAVTGCSEGTVILALKADSVSDAASGTGPAAAVVASTVTIDRSVPSTALLAVTPRAGGVLSGTAIPLALGWSGSDNAGGSGIARYELEQSRTGGAWTSVSKSLTAASARVTTPSSGTVQFRVRAVDKAGNTGAWTLGLTLSPSLVQQTSTAVKYSGTWSSGGSSSYSGGSVKYATVAGRSASYAFTGRSIALVTTKSPTRGKVKIYVNNSYVTTVDLYRSKSQYRAVVWQKTWSTSGARTVKLVVVGTSGRPRVDLDAFVVVK